VIFFLTVEHPAETPLDRDNNYFYFALENVSDEIDHNYDVASITMLEPVLNVQQDNVEHPPVHQHEEVLSQGDFTRLEGATTCTAPGVYYCCVQGFTTVVSKGPWQLFMRILFGIV
jgi:hypothetical protein